jgi:F-type H+-transporting ATPase subunit alpha
MLVLQGRNAAPAAFNAASMQARSFADAKAAPTEVSSILEQRIRGVQEEAGLAETGRVLSVGYVTILRKSLINGIQRARDAVLME